MTDKPISKAAKAKAKELIEREAKRICEGDMSAMPSRVALARVLQEHSDRASDASKVFNHQAGCVSMADGLCTCGLENFRRFLAPMILPDDEPDPLEDALSGIVPNLPTPKEGESYAKAVAAELREALSAAGYEIRRKDR